MELFLDSLQLVSHANNSIASTALGSFQDYVALVFANESSFGSLLVKWCVVQVDKACGASIDLDMASLSTLSLLRLVAKFVHSLLQMF
jgi:hypothetical protein